MYLSFYGSIYLMQLKKLKNSSIYNFLLMHTPHLCINKIHITWIFYRKYCTGVCTKWNCIFKQQDNDTNVHKNLTVSLFVRQNGTVQLNVYYLWISIL